MSFLWKDYRIEGPGDVILLYTGRRKRRAALGAWPRETDFAGYHADVAYFLKERGVSFIGGDGPNDVVPTGLPASAPNPLHRLALVAMGINIFDNLDFERAVEQARRLNRFEFLFTAAAAAHRKRNRIAAQSTGDFLSWQRSHSRHERDVAGPLRCTVGGRYGSD